MRKARKIILDCDPGHDDAVAMLMAGRHPAVELLGITTVRGNQSIEKTTNNALNVCQWLGIDVPVCHGLSNPIVRTARPVEDRLHGESGLDGPTFPPLTMTQDPRHAVDFIIETVLASAQPITLVATGPISNIGMAIRREPGILDNIEEIVLMGGSYQHGNVTPAAEFNVWADAEAAYVVFTCGRPVAMMGLDITRKVLCYPAIVDRMAKNGNRASQLFCDLMAFFNKTQKQVFGWEGGPLHDPTCLAYLIDPDCIKAEPMYTEIDISGGPSQGRTNCDIFHLSGKPHNSKVAVDIDVERFWDIVEECIRLYD